MDGIWIFIKGLADQLVGFITDPRTVKTVLLVLAVMFLLTLLTVVSKWRLYQKAGFPGWACMVPFYNDYVLVRLAGFSSWYFPITLLPTLDKYSFFVIQIMIARAFGRSIPFGIGLYALPVVFYPILWLSGAEYQHPKLSLVRKPLKRLMGAFSSSNAGKRLKGGDK